MRCPFFVLGIRGEDPGVAWEMAVCVVALWMQFGFGRTSWLGSGSGHGRWGCGGGGDDGDGDCGLVGWDLVRMVDGREDFLIVLGEG